MTRQGVATALATVALVTGAAGCAASRPLCAEGAALTAVGQLDRAAETYARARESGEGDCAGSGLDVVGDRYGDAWVAVVRGQVAEGRGDIESATTAYQAAVTFDVDNPAAREALGRLQQAIPLLREPDYAPPPPVVEPVPGWLLVLAVAAVGLLTAVVGLLSWGAWRARGRPTAEEAEAVVQGALQANARTVREAVATIVVDVDARLVGLPAELAGRQADARRADARRADALERHLEGILDVLDKIVTQDGGTTHRRFERPGL